MSRATLNRKLPFGEVWGGNLPARFTQNGRYFDANGDEVDIGAPPKLPTDPPPPQAGPTEAERNAAEAALAQRQAALQMQAFKLLNLATDKVLAELEDASDEMLPVLLHIETEVKNRDPVMAAIQAEIQRRADAAAEAASKTDQVSAQLQ